MPRLALLLCPVLALSACGLPRDAAGTLDRVRGGVLRAGAVHNPPFVVDDGSHVGGVEGALVEAFAHELGAKVTWVRAPEHVLVRALHARQLDVVVAGFDDTLVWKQEVAFTRPYYQDEKRHVLAAPPGENAWLVRLEQMLRASEPRVPALMAEAVR
jgi:ABC-type amino acid transport substrate-binding protein